MAQHYNLDKVYALSDNDQEFVMQIIQLFLTEVPQDVDQIRAGLDTNDHKLSYSYAHKIKPTLDLLGMEKAFHEILEIEAWTKREGAVSEIRPVFDSVDKQVKDAAQEFRKDYNL